MNPGERQNFLNHMFPIGGERWFKLKILDQEKALHFLSFNPKPEAMEVSGFECTKVSLVDELDRQLEILHDLERYLEDQRERLRQEMIEAGQYTYENPEEQSYSSESIEDHR